MANVKISELSTLTTPVPTDYFPVVDVSAGATRKLLLKSVNNYYNVKNYGAVGDNSTNDYAAILAACTAAANDGGGTVYFPPGIYVMSSTLSVPVHVNLVGEGGFDEDTTSNFDGSWIKGSIYFSGYNYFSDLKIGGTAAQSSVSSEYVSGDIRHDVYFERCRFRGGQDGWGGSVVAIPDVSTYFHDIHFKDCLFECPQGSYNAVSAGPMWFTCVCAQDYSTRDRWNISFDGCKFGVTNGVKTGCAGYAFVFLSVDRDTHVSKTYHVRVTNSYFEVTDEVPVNFACEGGATDGIASPHYGVIFANNVVRGGGLVGQSPGFCDMIVESNRRGIYANNYFGRARASDVKFTKDKTTPIGEGNQGIFIGNVIDNAFDNGVTTTGYAAIETYNSEMQFVHNTIIQNDDGHTRAFYVHGEPGMRNMLHGNMFIRTGTASESTGMFDLYGGGNTLISDNYIQIASGVTYSGGIFKVTTGGTPGSLIKDNYILYDGSSSIFTGSGTVFKKNNFYQVSSTYAYRDT